MIMKLAVRSALYVYSITSAFQSQPVAHDVYIDISKTSILPINICIDFSAHIVLNPFDRRRITFLVSLTEDSDSILGEQGESRRKRAPTPPFFLI